MLFFWFRRPLKSTNDAFSDAIAARSGSYAYLLRVMLMNDAATAAHHHSLITSILGECPVPLPTPRSRRAAPLFLLGLCAPFPSR